MREAVIVSTARTPIGKAYRGAFNDTPAQTLGGHVDRRRARRAPASSGGEVDDVVMGAALQQGSTGFNVARQCALRAGLPTSVAGMSVDRQCASGLMAIATAAKQIIARRHEHHRRRRARIDLAGAERPHEPLPRRPTRGSSRIATTSTCRCSRPPRSSPSATTITRERAGRLRAAIAAAHRRGAGRRALRRRDRAAADVDEGRRTRRPAPSATRRSRSSRTRAIAPTRRSPASRR